MNRRALMFGSGAVLAGSERSSVPKRGAPWLVFLIRPAQ